MNIVAEMDEPDRSTVEMFMRALGTNEQVAIALVAAGLTIIEEVAYIPLQELLEVEGVEKKLLLSLRERARSHLLNDVMGRG